MAPNAPRYDTKLLVRRMSNTTPPTPVTPPAPKPLISNPLSPGPRLAADSSSRLECRCPPKSSPRTSSRGSSKSCA